MKDFQAALAFLTIIPALRRGDSGGERLAAAVFYFPVVGLVIGLAAAGLDFLFTQVLPSGPAAALTVAVMAAVSGGLHMDGLSDTADGFMSGAGRRERILEIMSDSRAGPMGVLAVVLAVALKVTALGAIEGAARWQAVALAPLAGRCLVAFAMSALPYVKKEGLGAAFRQAGTPLNAAWAVLFFILAAAALGGWMGAAVLAACATSVCALCLLSLRTIGGMTGDVYGAVCETAETAALLAAAAWVYGG
ncbi:MAG: adenosylcobinamide-GDP ribazoletransferase [Candidatus Nitrospinota bacterium M3_3B_026]